MSLDAPEKDNRSVYCWWRTTTPNSIIIYLPCSYYIRLRGEFVYTNESLFSPLVVTYNEALAYNEAGLQLVNRTHFDLVARSNAKRFTCLHMLENANPHTHTHTFLLTCAHKQHFNIVHVLNIVPAFYLLCRNSEFEWSTPPFVTSMNISWVVVCVLRFCATSWLMCVVACSFALALLLSNSVDTHIIQNNKLCVE